MSLCLLSKERCVLYIENQKTQKQMEKTNHTLNTYTKKNTNLIASRCTYIKHLFEQLVLIKKTIKPINHSNSMWMYSLAIVNTPSKSGTIPKGHYLKVEY